MKIWIWVLKGYKYTGYIDIRNYQVVLIAYV